MNYSWLHRAAFTRMYSNLYQQNGQNQGPVNPPSRAMLAAFKASLKLMDDETLAELHGRFVALSEHPAGIRAMDHEMKRRRRATYIRSECYGK